MKPEQATERLLPTFLEQQRGQPRIDFMARLVNHMPPKRRKSVSPSAKVALVGIIIALPSEVTEEVALTAIGRDDDSIIDVDVNVSVPSTQLVARLEDAERLTDDRHAARTALAMHDSDMLTPTERKQAANDLWRYRHPILCWLVPADFFAKRVIPA